MGFIFYVLSGRLPVDLDKQIEKNVDPNYSGISTASFILKVPISEYSEPGNRSSDFIVVGYKDEVYEKGAEFIFDVAGIPGDFGNPVNEYEIAAMKVRVLEINKGSIVLEEIETVGMDLQFHPPYGEPRILKILNNECIYADPLVMDVAYHYCFTIEIENNQMAVKYRVKGSSTLPRP